MTHLRSVVRRLSPWAPARRPGAELDWPPARPVRGPLLWLVIILIAALAFQALRPSVAPVVWRGDIAGTARIIDGDTIDIAGTRIRLAGIDAPESDQTCTDAAARPWACGQVATRALVAHVAGQPLKCQVSGLDPYRRVLAVCVLPDGSDINAWMVQQGWALAYTQYSDAYGPEEAQAQAAARGIWNGSFIPPWDWRHQHQHHGWW
jgi:endonuclease YncB( thermonuclease family)